LTGVFNQYLVTLNGALIGFMLFFVIVVSPVVFKTLSQDEATRFLRAIFPRLFLVGLFTSLVMVLLSLGDGDQGLVLILTAIAVGFAINYFILTPNINKTRDAVLAGDVQKEKQFKILHLLSVGVFIVQIFAAIFIAVTNIQRFSGI